MVNLIRKNPMLFFLIAWPLSKFLILLSNRIYMYFELYKIEFDYIIISIIFSLPYVFDGFIWLLCWDFIFYLFMNLAQTEHFLFYKKGLIMRFLVYVTSTTPNAKDGIKYESWMSNW